jgi:uncharacterized membrane protein
MTVKYLDDGNPDGHVLGQNATTLIGFWGATATAQPASTAAVSATAIASNGSTIWGFSTSTQGDALIALVRAMHANMISVGLKRS